ncbi:MAG: hypothetical protein AAGN46_04035 [Acidobacteriota bacterium]
MTIRRTLSILILIGFASLAGAAPPQIADTVAADGAATAEMAILAAIAPNVEPASTVDCQSEAQLEAMAILDGTPDAIRSASSGFACNACSVDGCAGAAPGTICGYRFGQFGQCTEPYYISCPQDPGSLTCRCWYGPIP